MNIYLLISGILTILLGVVHSILGEFLIFKNKRKPGKIVPTIVNSDFKERQLRIIWTTWHLASFFGWCIGIYLLQISLNQNKFGSELIDFLINPAICMMFASSILVLIGTKGKHPGWIVLLVIGILLLFSK